MLKRVLAWKYVFAVVIILGGAIYVSRQDQKTRDEYEQKCQQLNNGAVSPSQRNEDCDKGAENAARHLPRWYRVFGWPEGITTWAILFTLLALAEQTSQTRRAAEATSVQAEISRKAFVSQFRPKVPVRAMWLTGDAGGLNVEIWVTNTGSTPAHIAKSDIKVAWEVPAESKKKIVASAVFLPISLQSGQDHAAIVDITEISVPYGVAKIAVEEMGREQEAWIHCFGNLTYLDDNGASRSTRFFRRYDMKRKRFVPSDDPEEEYTD